MKKSILTLALSALCFTPNLLMAQAKFVEKVEQKGSEVTIPYSKYVLPNGLTVLVHEDHSDPIVHVDVTYHVGSAREEIGKSGFAHFFEHMMFQGSDNVADEEHFKIITEAGGTLNGTTNRDRTNYFETVPKNQLEKMLWLEADRMGFFLDAVTQQKFEIQRATVKNERGQNYDNRPYGLVGETASKYLYPYGHPYSWLTIGYIEDLNRVNVEDLKNFFLRWYGPNNATLTVGGDVNTADVLKLVEKYFGSIPRGPEVTNMAPSYPSLATDRYVTMVDQYAKLPMLRVVYPTPQWYTKEEVALDVVADILGGGKTSILYQQLVKTQKAAQASCYNYASELAGEFTFSIVPFKGHTLKEMDEELRKAFEAFEKRGVSQQDIDKYVSETEAATIYSLESVSGKVSRLAAFETFRNDPNYIQKYLNLYRSLKPADVMAAYEKFLKGKGSVRLSVATKDEPNDIAGDSKFEIDQNGYVAPNYGYDNLVYNKAKDNFDRSKMPNAGDALSIVAPKFWQTKEKNITFIGTENDEIPVTNLMVKLPGGKITDTEDKQGLADIFAAMMNEDTEQKTAEEFAKELEHLGSSISVSNGRDGIYFNVRTLTKNLDATLALLQERMTQAKFTQVAFDRITKQYTEGYKNSLTRPASVASTVLSKLLYGNTPMAWPSGGTDKTIPNITLADIQAYKNKYYSLFGAQVVVVGDLSQKEIMPKLNFLTKLEQKKVSLPTLPEFKHPAKQAKQKLYFIDFPGAAQTEFRIAQLTDMKYDATGDYFKSGIMNFPLGGVFNSRLNLYLREEKGWTYGARTGFGGSKYAGNFAFSGGILASATDSALHDVLHIIQEYKTNGATEDELKFTKSAKIQSEARQYETGNQKAGYLMEVSEYNLPKDFAQKQNSILKNITLNEINTLAKTKIRNNDEFLILLVGDQKHLSEKTKAQFEIVFLDKEGNPVK
jgi:zinc protease